MYSVIENIPSMIYGPSQDLYFIVSIRSVVGTVHTWERGNVGKRVWRKLCY